MKLLAFSPAANIWVHAYPEALIVDAARSEGFDVVVASCGGLLRHHCVAMDEAGVGPDAIGKARSAICASCVRRANGLERAFDFDTRVLDRYVTAHDRVEVEDVVSSVDLQRWADFEDDGIPVGRYAAYEFLLKNKISSPVIPPALRAAYLDQLRNALFVHVAAPRLLDDVAPDVACAYNTLYSMNRVFKAHCERRGIDCYSLQGGPHLRNKLETMTMYRDDAASLAGPRSDAWREARTRPIGAPDVALVMDAVRELFSARSAFVYSAQHGGSTPSDTRASLGLSMERKTALVALSSRDEMFAADVVGRFSKPIDGTFLFATQLEWLEFVIKIARRRDDLQFIVRVHPREFPNKREGVMSPNVEALGRTLADIPTNVHVDWPTEGRGIYDVLQVSDVVLSGWSSVGVESALFGLPVVTYDTGELLGYPAELATVVRQRENYESAIEEAVASGVQLDRVTAAFRWYAFLYSRLSVDLSDSVPPRAGWSARRVLQGLRSQTRVPVPLWPISMLERRELRGRAAKLRAAPVIADTLAQGRANLAESTAWPDSSVVSNVDEHRVIEACVTEMVELLGNANDQESLAARLAAAVAVSAW